MLIWFNEIRSLTIWHIFTKLSILDLCQNPINTSSSKGNTFKDKNKQYGNGLLGMYKVLKEANTGHTCYHFEFVSGFNRNIFKKHSFTHLFPI